MEEQLREILKGLPEEEMEFYTRGLIALLRQQQTVHRIPDRKFQRKFTALFRLYGPFIQECYGFPEKLLKTYLTWENSFFNSIALCHHRDAARERHIPDMIRLLDADEDVIAQELAEISDALLQKLEAQRIKDAEIKAKRAQKKSTKKKTQAYVMGDDESKVMLKETLAMRRYCAEARDAILETRALVTSKPVSAELHVEQIHASTCLDMVKSASASLKEKAAAADSTGRRGVSFLNAFSSCFLL